MLFIPLGGSNVILREFYNIDIGKFVVGIEDNQRRKSLLVSFKLKQIYSKFSIQELAKWQFYKNIQPPILYKLLIIFSPFIP